MIPAYYLPPPALTPPALVQAFDPWGSATVCDSVPHFSISTGAISQSELHVPDSFGPALSAMELAVQLALIAEDVLPKSSGDRPSGKRLREIALLARRFQAR